MPVSTAEFVARRAITLPVGEGDSACVNVEQLSPNVEQPSLIASPIGEDLLPVSMTNSVND